MTEKKEMGVLDLAKELSPEFHFNDFVINLVGEDLRLNPDQIATLKMTFYAGMVCLNSMIEIISNLPLKEEAKMELMASALSEVEKYVMSKEKGKQLLQ